MTLFIIKILLQHQLVEWCRALGLYKPMRRQMRVQRCSLLLERGSKLLLTFLLVL